MVNIGRPQRRVLVAIGLAGTAAVGCAPGTDGSDGPDEPSGSGTATEPAVPVNYCETLAAELLPDRTDPDEYRIDAAWGTGSTR
ncbi:hypothetical protein [Glycomyces xiaoerkulensis]|uniref:hypothetical protein n=1 Tax=Glycomyces xiaoerkulensis TaxID=2038139 RepID=UPI000C266011|nr:hypothetical protein [Glycomyces xiaoerkulensis]